MKKTAVLALTIAFLVGTSALFAQESEKPRGFYFDAGLGLSGMAYFGDVGGMVTALDQAGFESFTVSLGATFGYAITQDIYAVGSLALFLKGMDRGSENIDLTTTLLGVGLRYYPLPSMRVLQLGGDLGLARIVITTNLPDVPPLSGSDFGFGLMLSAAIDFAASMTGPSFLLGSDFMLAFVQSETVVGFSIFAKFALR
ncbi:MAG: hypothetical protein FWE09_02145 [Treponema sp.]|nr:hypothetical protein [Treponema sp.]